MHYPLVATIALLLAFALPAQESPLPERPAGGAGDGEAKDDAKPSPDFSEFSNDPRPTDQDIIILKNGSRFSGRFRAIEGTKVIIRDSEVGDIRIDPKDIFRFWLGNDLDIYYQEAQADDVRQAQLQRGNYSTTPDGLLVRLLDDDGERPRRYELANLHKVSLTSYEAKPPEWAFTGDLSAFIQIDEGNTQRQTYGNDFRLELKHPKHIFNTRTTGSVAETENRRSTQRVTSEFSYRFVFSERNALFFRQDLLHDDFARLRVRSVSALGLTYFLFREDTFTLSTDLGFSYTEEHNKRNIRNRYFNSAQFQVNSEWKPKDDLRVTFQSRTNTSLETPSNFNIQNDLNIAITLYKNVTTSINLEFDHNSEPPTNIDKDDYRVRFLIGWRIR